VKLKRDLSRDIIINALKLVQLNMLCLLSTLLRIIKRILDVLEVSLKTKLFMIKLMAYPATLKRRSSLHIVHTISKKFSLRALFQTRHPTTQLCIRLLGLESQEVTFWALNLKKNNQNDSFNGSKNLAMN
jgi:hypothetical protein